MLRHFVVEDGLTQAAWVFEPEGSPKAVLVCLPGGTYDKHYWHLEVPGHADYSFAEHLRDQGFVVVALDHLGVGESSEPPGRGGLLDLARGDAEVARQVRALFPGVPVVGVGHSMGSCLTTIVQATEAVYDAVVLLGYGVQVANLPSAETTVAANYELLRQLTGAEEGAASWVVPRDTLRQLFHGPDVPAEVVAADDAVASRLPAWANAEVITPGFEQDYVGTITVPVFLGLGGLVDVSPDPYAEVGQYRASSNVTLHVVADSAHCHNFSSRRTELWDRIGRWICSVT